MRLKEIKSRVLVIQIQDVNRDTYLQTNIYNDFLCWQHLLKFMAVSQRFGEALFGPVSHYYGNKPHFGVIWCTWQHRCNFWKAGSVFLINSAPSNAESVPASASLPSFWSNPSQSLCWQAANSHLASPPLKHLFPLPFTHEQKGKPKPFSCLNLADLVKCSIALKHQQI